MVKGIVCRSFEDSSTGQSHLLQFLSTALRPKILESIHSSTTTAHLGNTKTLEKLRTRFYWPGHKKDVSVTVSSCLVYQQRNSHKQKHRHSLVICPPSFLFAHIGIDFLAPLQVSNGNSYEVLFGDHFKVVWSGPISRSHNWKDGYRTTWVLDYSLWCSREHWYRPRSKIWV